MPMRLIVDLGDRVVRFSLTDGTVLVGSEGECDVRIRHPTVSRKHAHFSIDDDIWFVEDLGSSNGTRIDNRSINGRTEVHVGDHIRFGSVSARVEGLDTSDLEPGISLPEPPGGGTAPVPAGGGAHSTIGPAVLEIFSLKQLPELTEMVASGRSRTEVVQAVGAALFGSLPCHCVEIGTERDAGGGLLFQGERPGAGGGVDRSCDLDRGGAIRVQFLNAALADRFEPLLHIGASLIRASGPRSEAPGSKADRGPTVPGPPQPASVVPEVIGVYAQAARIAGSPVSVLIRGESGTGKELLARFLHAASDRADAPLVTLNCAALPSDLLESELFGIERGVATGVEARPGRFETAHGGTLLLDEIGDMALETQAKILRVLQEKEVYRVGGVQARPADVRILSATNRDIDGMLADGRFRSDLYHRIADWVVHLPPLRDRVGDLPNLAVHFLGRACEARGVRPSGISRGALDRMAAYSWPGNIRQLEKEMRRAALFVEDGQMLDSSDLQPMISGSGEGPSPQSLKEVLERAERDHVQRVIEACGGDVSAAAERLGLGLSTLYRRIKVLGIQEGPASKDRA